MSINNFYKNGPVGCLLVHGFTGSPNELLDLGEFLASKKLTVSIPALPGHGTHSGDLFNYTWRDWFDAVKTAYHELHLECDEVFLCGLSMGGALALHLAAHEPSVKGIVTLSGAIHFPAWKKIVVKGLKGVVKFRHKKHGEDVRDTSTRPRLGSYRRYPYSAVDKLFELIEHVRDDLPKVTQPILIIHSRKDHTIPFSNSEIIFRLVGSTDKRKVDLSESYHIITVDVEKEKVREEIFEFIQQHSQHLKPRSVKKLEEKVS